jgi:glucose/arabinose dehydrogenase
MIKFMILLAAASISGPVLLAQPSAESGVAFSVEEKARLESIVLPKGFSIDYYAKVPGARSLTRGPGGVIFVGSRGQGKVYALLGRDGGPQADKVVTIAGGLNSPNGIAYLGGDLYVAEIGRIIVFRDIADNLTGDASFDVITDVYPEDRAHGWKFIAFGPDGLLYVPVGAPCNICEREDPVYSSITRFDAAGTAKSGSIGRSDIEIYASGIRNTVGFDWHPVTKELWFTDNGRDWLGDNRPPDELNRVTETGQHFGFPYLHGKDIRDPEFGDDMPAGLDPTPPVRELGPHVAALGMRFYTGSTFPEEYRNRIFIAEHGSWNRSEKIGYRVMMVSLDGNRALSYKPFAEGWLDKKSGEAWGRPVDVLVLEDGSLLVSDDSAGYVYRINYDG